MLRSRISGVFFLATAICGFSPLGGCTILTSETFQQISANGEAPRGQQYSLARGLLHAELVYDASIQKFVFDIKQGDIVPDPNHEYVLRYRQNPAYKDEILVDTENGLLEKVETTTEDRTPAAIVNIAKAIAALGGYESTPQTIQLTKLLSRPFDPLDPDDIDRLKSDVDLQISNHITKQINACEIVGGKDASRAATFIEQLGDAQKTKAIEVSSKKAQLEIIKALVGPAKKAVNRLDAGDVDVLTATNRIESCQQKKTTNEASEKHWCHLASLLKKQDDAEAELKKMEGELTGIEANLSELVAQQKSRSAPCMVFAAYQKSKPKLEINLVEQSELDAQADHITPNGYAIPEADCTEGICYRPLMPVRVTYQLGGGAHTKLFDLPNPHQVVAIDIRRAFFVQKIQKMTFDRGMLTSLEVKKDSELLAVSQLPVSIISAIGDALKIRVGIQTSQKSILDKETALLKAQEALAQSVQQPRFGAAESSLNGGQRYRAQGASSP